MKLSLALSCATALLPSTAYAGWFSRITPRGSGSGCSFTISSKGSFVCPAGELPDGQIRINGTEDTAKFSISNGAITDSHGYGCIVTAPPTTQVQCDQGATPDPNFSIDSSGNILYKGSPDFFACPATDTEYNLYVNPNFGQPKCFAVQLEASGCGAAPPPTSSTPPATAPAPPPTTSSCPPAGTSTVWQTATVTQDTTSTITITSTSYQSCSTTSSVVPLPSSNLSSTICPHCTGETSQSFSSTWSAAATAL